MARPLLWSADAEGKVSLRGDLVRIAALRLWCIVLCFILLFGPALADEVLFEKPICPVVGGLEIEKRVAWFTARHPQRPLTVLVESGRTRREAAKCYRKFDGTRWLPEPEKIPAGERGAGGLRRLVSARESRR